MPQFDYTGRHPTNGKVSGTVEAADKIGAIKAVERLGCIPIQIGPHVNKPPPPPPSPAAAPRVAAVPVTTHVQDDGQARCPKCGSTSIQGERAGFGAGKGCCGWIMLGPIGLLCGACGKNKMYSHCLRCGHKWKLG